MCWVGRFGLGDGDYLIGTLSICHVLRGLVIALIAECIGELIGELGWIAGWLGDVG